MKKKNVVVFAKVIMIINWLVLFLSVGHRVGSPGLSAFSENVFFFWTWTIPLSTGLIGILFSGYMRSGNFDEIDTYTETKNILGASTKPFTRTNSIAKSLRIISWINIVFAILLFIFTHYGIFFFLS